MAKCVIPDGYASMMSAKQTNAAIKRLKDHFELGLARALNLTRVSAPLFVSSSTGLNDNLNGVERPVSFDIFDKPGENAEIVQSLAKWKRLALKEYDFGVGEGLYTDMNAIRRDEEMDNLHTIYVDQWDWEMIVGEDQRSLDTLYDVVRAIYRVFKRIEMDIYDVNYRLKPVLPKEITCLTAQELEDKYPGMTPKMRENTAAREYGAVFVSQIGGALKSGIRHDGRAPDYDDWSLNGDILFDYPLLNCAMEMSSMGIRVNPAALRAQLRAAGREDWLNMPFHRRLYAGELPQTIGGGLGQSRLCMFFLKKAHIGEVQASIWDDATLDICRRANVILL